MKWNLVRTVRNFAFIVMCAVMFYANQVGVRAYDSAVWGAMNYWTQYYSCSKSGWEYAASINCNFPDEDDEWETLSSAMGDDLWAPCTYTCGNQYAAFVSELHSRPQYCYDTWETYGSGGSPEDSYAFCTCNAIDYCIE